MIQIQIQKQIIYNNLFVKYRQNIIIMGEHTNIFIVAYMFMSLWYAYIYACERACVFVCDYSYEKWRTPCCEVILFLICIIWNIFLPFKLRDSIK